MLNDSTFRLTNDAGKSAMSPATSGGDLVDDLKDVESSTALHRHLLTVSFAESTEERKDN